VYKNCKVAVITPDYSNIKYKNILYIYIYIYIMLSQKTFRTSRESEITPEFNNTIKKLYDIVHNEIYYNKCLEIHKQFMRNLIDKPLETYYKLKTNSNESTAHLEGVVLKLLKEIFKINENEQIKFGKRREELLIKKQALEESTDISKHRKEIINVEMLEINKLFQYLEKDINQYNALFQQCIMKVSQIFFKSRYYLTYRPTIETIVDMLSFIDTSCRSNSCKGSENPYFHSRRYLYYLKYLLDQHNKGHFLIPTHQITGATAFIKIRCVPVYILGCNYESEFADEYYNTPLEFFSHDVQHARRQLYYTEQQLYKNNGNYDRFINHSTSRSVFDINNDINLPNYDSLWDTFINSMVSFTKTSLVPLLEKNNSNPLQHVFPLNLHITNFNKNLDDGLKSMRKMIIFEILHEAAIAPTRENIIDYILLDVHSTPIERFVNDADLNYTNVQNIIYTDPSTLSNVLYKTKGTFFDTVEERYEMIVPVKYRNPIIIALSALQILSSLSYNYENDHDSMFNKLLHLTLNRENRLQSTTNILIETLRDKSKTYKITDFINSNGELIVHDEFIMDTTTRTTIYDDPSLKPSIPNFYGPRIGDQSAKVAIFGGTFDPIHDCHKLRIEQLYSASSLYKVIIAVAPNTQRKIHTSPIESRYKWTQIIIEEILKENNDKSLTSFKQNPKNNISKIQLIEGKDAGEVIQDIREQYKGTDVIFVYGNDYRLKEGNETPLDDFNIPTGYTKPGNFYRGVTQIQFTRSPVTCNASSSAIQNFIERFIEANNEMLKTKSSISDLSVYDEAIQSSLKDSARALEININILLLYLEYRFTQRKLKGGKNKYHNKYLKYKQKYLNLKLNL
jgi:hypothetical protein